MIAALAATEGGGHSLPPSVFTPLWKLFAPTELAKSLGFDKPLGQVWFEGLCFAVVVSAILILLAFVTTRKLNRVPRGIQNLLELAVSGIRGMVRGMAGPEGDRYVPFIGTAFLMIFLMNLMGVLPLGRSATMALSITAGMGVTAFVMTIFYVLRDAGVGGVAKHLAGPVWWLAPLIFVAELLSMFIRPVSLSMRLFGNIYGEDNVIEAFLGLIPGVPLHFPILGLALLTAFLQAYIFTMLCTYYIASMTAHEEGHDEQAPSGVEGGHGEKGPAAEHAH